MRKFEFKIEIEIDEDFKEYKSESEIKEIERLRDLIKYLKKEDNIYDSELELILNKIYKSFKDQFSFIYDDDEFKINLREIF